MILSIIGGASGVGKTSLLKLFSNINQVNTGDLFKRAMTLGNRDEIKKGDWSIFENDVMSDMIDITAESIRNNVKLIIDTHFSAKIFGMNYRIGLKEEYLHRFGETIFELDKNDSLLIKVVLISTNPYLLLSRRRKDNSRKRELIPSDCYNDLRSNDIYSRRYLSALKKVAKNFDQTCKIEYYIIENNKFDLAQKQLNKILVGV